MDRNLDSYSNISFFANWKFITGSRILAIQFLVCETAKLGKLVKPNGLTGHVFSIELNCKGYL